MKTVMLLVELDLPEGTSQRSAVDYVRAAINSHHGCLDPSDPWSGLSEEHQVRVAIRRKRGRATACAPGGARTSADAIMDQVERQKS